MNLTLLPGWCLGRGPLQATAAALGAAIVDLPGYGATPFAADFNVAADRLAENLPAGGTLAGWSLGALLALAVAARQPHKVSRLLLVSATPSFVTRADWAHGIAPEALSALAAAFAADPAAARQRFVANFQRGETAARALTRTTLALADPLPSAATLAAGLDWLAGIDLRPLLPSIRVPVHLLHGENDPLMPLAAATALQAALPNATLTVLPGAAHTPFLAQPEACVAAARRLLA